MEILKNNVFLNGLDRIIYWSKFFAITMIIFGVLIVLGAIVTLSGFSGLDEIGFGAGPGLLMFFLYIIGALLYIIPGTWLLRFSNKTRKGVNEEDESEFAEGFRNLGRYYTFWGVTYVVFVLIYGIILIGSLIVLVNT